MGKGSKRRPQVADEQHVRSEWDRIFGGTMREIFFTWNEEFSIEAVFDAADGTLIAAWDANDADWRSEYFSPLLKWCGVVEVSEPKVGREERARQVLRNFGLEEE